MDEHFWGEECHRQGTQDSERTLGWVLSRLRDEKGRKKLTSDRTVYSPRSWTDTWLSPKTKETQLRVPRPKYHLLSTGNPTTTKRPWIQVDNHEQTPMRLLIRLLVQPHNRIRMSSHISTYSSTSTQHTIRLQAQGGINVMHPKTPTNPTCYNGGLVGSS